VSRFPDCPLVKGEGDANCDDAPPFLLFQQTGNLLANLLTGGQE
jgi:hypothetical protein